MDTKKSVKPLNTENSGNPLPVFREWLMEGNDPNTEMEGEPLWAWLLQHGWFDALDEAWQAGTNPNTKDSMGRGWLHYAITEGIPTWVAQDGFRRLDATWWHPDELGRTPFHLPIFDEALANSLMVRWWSEEQPWQLLVTPFDPMGSTLPQAAQWSRWKPALRP